MKAEKSFYVTNKIGRMCISIHIKFYKKIAQLNNIKSIGKA